MNDNRDASAHHFLTFIKELKITFFAWYMKNRGYPSGLGRPEG